jgi:hypothetical protein
MRVEMKRNGCCGGVPTDGKRATVLTDQVAVRTADVHAKSESRCRTRGLLTLPAQIRRDCGAGIFCE